MFLNNIFYIRINKCLFLGDENGSVKPSDYDAGTYIIPESDTSLTIRKSEPKSEGNKDSKKTGDKPTIPPTLPKKEKAVMPPCEKAERVRA